MSRTKAAKWAGTLRTVKEKRVLYRRQTVVAPDGAELQSKERVLDKFQLRRPRQMTQRMRRRRLRRSETVMGKGRQPWINVVTTRLDRVRRAEIVT